MASERPFTLSIPEAELVLLKDKLALTRFPDELEDAGWDYGVPLSDIQRLTRYWKDGYDWRKAETSINAELSMFKRQVHVENHGGLNIHYVHQPSAKPNAIPLMFVHGCK